ncbi:LacI family DNA-binding transcriptional regulator [Oceanicola sp. 22II-s10i]|uniref:LacI family DNA-binding transcriptional regulator n=1 Tax=Oceanicola sp. 22II-s10i TaxID=1317116 RepID=UPI000B52489E|nr:LacI family DNA-binding transcriptional regulator [Oceanicola sp. 22II-s10i]
MNVRRFPTTAEISREAGVNKSTVSRALKADPRISEATRKRILEIAESMGYAPNAIAQSLATNNSNIVAFVGSETQNYWYQENIQTLARQVTQAGRQLMLFQVMRGGTIDDVIPQMIQYRVAGCIVIPAVEMTDTAAERLRQFGISMVLLNRPGEAFGASSVRQDQAEGGRGVAHFLVAGGHRRIAFIAGNMNPAAQDRERGFLAGLKEIGVEPFAIDRGEFTFRGAYAAATRLLQAEVRPDAIFAANDMMAYATIEAARAAGLTVPDDLSVVGYDNGRVGAWPGFRLTTVAQPIERMFGDALGLILDRQDKPDLPPDRVGIAAGLLIRDSARVPEDLGALPIDCRRDGPFG